MTTPEFYAQTIEQQHARIVRLEREQHDLDLACKQVANENQQLLADKARDQLVLRDITARAEQLAAEVRQWRMCYNQDENKPFDWKSEGK